MNKTTKGGIAAAASAALLLGGAGSLAYWNTTDTVTGGAFNTGELRFDYLDCDAANWVVTNAVEDTTQELDTPTTTALADFDAVPGDVFTKTCDIEVFADGDNLRAILDITGGGVTTDAAGPGDPAIRTADYTVTPTFSLAGTETITAGTPFTIDEDDNGKLIAVSITVDFPLEPTGDTEAVDDSQRDTLSLDDYTITAEQARTPAAP